MNRIVAVFAALTAAILLAALASISSKPGTLLHDLEAPSPALGRPIIYTLYKPAEAPPPGERWPVLYLYHGLGGNERDWVTVGRAAETLDRMISSGRLKPLLVVMPMAGDSWYVDNEDEGGAGRMAEALSNDLVRHVDASWPTAACRNGRAVGGPSLGGYGALLYAFDQPDRFGAAISLSGSVFLPVPPDRAERVNRATGMFGGVFGDPFDSLRFNHWNLFPRIPGIAKLDVRPALYLAVGDDDFRSVMRGNALFHEALEKAGVAADYRVDAGSPGWTLWSRQLGPALQWLDDRISGKCP